MVHINRVRPLLEEDTENIEIAGWSPPLFQEDSSETSVPLDSADNVPFNNFQRLEVAVLLSLLTTMATNC